VTASSKSLTLKGIEGSASDYNIKLLEAHLLLLLLFVVY
jgi:hypothetical protein